MPDAGGLGIAWKVAVDAVPNNGESKDPRDSKDPRSSMDTNAAAQQNEKILNQLDKKGSK